MKARKDIMMMAVKPKADIKDFTTLYALKESLEKMGYRVLVTAKCSTNNTRRVAK